MRLGPGLLALLLVFALVGCGGGDDAKNEALTRPTSEGPIGEGSSGVWIYRPAGEPKHVVIYLHGQGGPTEATPKNHLPWIKHLVSRGSVVVYPRYEMDYEADPMRFVIDGVKTAGERVDLEGLPVLAMGYSRGGGLAVEYGAVAGENDLPVPDAILGVFPGGVGNAKNPIDLESLPQTTELLFMVGDQDEVVGGQGAAFISARLRNAGFPGDNIQLAVVESRGSFVANHFAPMETTPAARAAFWGATDVILEALDEG